MTDTARKEFVVGPTDANGLRLVVNRLDTGRIGAYVIANDGTNLARVELEPPTRGTESTQPAEQDPDAHTDGTTAQEPYRTYQDAIDALRDDDRYRNWWSTIVQSQPDYDYWGKGRLELAEYLETIANEPSKITNPEQVAATIGSLASRKSDLLGLLAGKSDHDVVSVELLRRVLADGSGPVDLIVELDRLRALVGDEDAGEADWHGITRAAAIRQSEEARTAMLRWLTEHDARRDERDDARDEVKQLRAELAAMRGDYETACATVARMHAAAVGEVRGPIRGVVEDVADLKADRDQGVRRATRRAALLANIREALDQAEQDARTARAEIQRLGDMVDQRTEQLAEAQSRLRISEARRNMWTGRASNALKRIATLTSDQPTQAEYGAAAAALLSTGAVSPAYAGFAKLAVDAAWKVNRAPRTEDQPVTGVNKQADFMPDSMPAQVSPHDLNRAINDAVSIAVNAFEAAVKALPGWIVAYTMPAPPAGVLVHPAGCTCPDKV